MSSIAYRYVDTDGEVTHGKLYRDQFYHCFVRNKIVSIFSASCGFGVYLRALYTETFLNNS